MPNDFEVAKDDTKYVTPARPSSEIYIICGNKSKPWLDVYKVLDILGIDRDKIESAEYIYDEKEVVLACQVILK